MGGEPGLTSGEFRKSAAADLETLGNVTVIRMAATNIEGSIGRFKVIGADGAIVIARRIILATGVEDLLPTLLGLPKLWGVQAFRCAYCDGHESRGARWGVLGCTPDALTYLPMMRGWTDQIAAFVGNPDGTEAVADRDLLVRLGVEIRTERLLAVETPASRSLFCWRAAPPCMWRRFGSRPKCNLQRSSDA